MLLGDIIIPGCYIPCLAVGLIFDSGLELGFGADVDRQVDYNIFPELAIVCVVLDCDIGIELSVILYPALCCIIVDIFR